MSQTSKVDKPSLTGVRIKARKGAVKANAKHEPSIFRDQVFRHLETVPAGDFEGYANKLITAGSTLDFSKYADALFELLLVGGLLQPGGTYVEDGAPPCPFSLFNAAHPPKVDEIRQYVEVYNKVIRRYKYLQRPLEQVTLPGLLQYFHQWQTDQKDKLTTTVAVMLSTNLVSSSCLLSLTKDHLVKDDVAIKTLCQVFKVFLADQTMDHLAVNLQKGGVKDLLAFLPVSKRYNKTLDEALRSNGVPQVADWHSKRTTALASRALTRDIKERIVAEDPVDVLLEFIQEQQQSDPIPETDVVSAIWASLVGSVDWDSVKADQMDAVAVRELSKYIPVMEPFSQGSKTQINLLNTVQVWCYENTKVMKTFPQILKVLYNADCVSDKAILYWHEKGSKPEGRQHFLKATEPLVKILQEQDDSDEEE